MRGVGKDEREDARAASGGMILTAMPARAYLSVMGMVSIRALKEATSGSQAIPSPAPGVASFSARGVV